MVLKSENSLEVLKEKFKDVNEIKSITPNEIYKGNLHSEWQQEDEKFRRELFLRGHGVNLTREMNITTLHS